LRPLPFRRTGEAGVEQYGVEVSSSVPCRGDLDSRGGGVAPRLLHAPEVRVDEFVCDSVLLHLLKVIDVFVEREGGIAPDRRRPGYQLPPNASRASSAPAATRPSIA